MMTLRLNRLEQRLDDNSFRLREALRRDTEARSRRLIAIENRVRAHDPRVRLLFSRTRLEALRQRLADSIRKRILSPVPALGRLDERLRAAVRFHVSRSRPRVEALTASLASLSPLRVLDRGYAIVQDAGGTALKSPPASGTKLSIRYAEGRGTAVSAGAAAPTPGDSSELPS
jgi:exodeoxyribonuclease VII large subunit